MNERLSDYFKNFRQPEYQAWSSEGEFKEQLDHLSLHSRLMIVPICGLFSVPIWRELKL